MLTTFWTGTDTSQTGVLVEFVVEWTKTSNLVKGVKIYVDTNKTNSWEGIDSVQLKGTPPSDTTAPTGTIVINAASTYTTSTAATLTLTCTDNSGSCSQMRFSNDNATWSNQEAYSTTKAWTLASGDGVKTVYVKFRDTTGNWSSTYSDSITLDTTNPTGTITINNYAAYATSISTTLNLNATDTNGIRMQFSNDGTTWTVLEAPAATKAYTLPSGEGTKIVYVRYEDNAGNSITLSDNITLDTTSFFQYANLVSGYSSQYPSTSYYATQALGAPNAGYTGGNQWLPSSTNGTSEVITLEFATPVYADGLAIREAYGNGFVTQIDLLDLDDLLTTLWTGTDTSQTGELVEFVVAWTKTTNLVKGVKIYVNTDKTTAWEGIDSVQIKGTPPSDIIVSIGTIVLNAASTYTTSTAATLTLSCTDNSGSCSHMRFSNDNATWSSQEAYSTTKAWTLANGDGVKTVYVKFRDTTGNWSSTYSDSITLDTTNPTGSITINNYAAYATSTSTTLNLNATDTNGIRMQFSNDGITWTALEAPAATKAYSLPSGDGTKRVYVRYEDNAGNSTTLSDTITLDTTSFFQYANVVSGYSSQYTSSSYYATQALGAPNATYTSGNQWLSSSTNGTSEYITLEFTTPVYADGVAIRESYGNGFVYKVDVIDLSNTLHTVWTGIDQSPSGALIDFNVSWARTTYTVKGVKIYVDTDKTNSWEGIDSVQLRGGMSYENNPPTGTITVNSGSNYTNTSTVSVRFTCTDVESYCAEMSLSDDGLIWISELYVPVVARSLPGGDGIKTVYVKFKDSAGNWSAVINDSITLDTTAPVTVSSPVAGTFIAAMSAGLAASEPSTIRYTTNGDEPTVNSSIYSGLISIRATTTLKYFAVDVAGNQESVQTSLYTINDLTPPIGTIVINSNSPYTTSSTVSLVLTCSEGEGICEEMQFSDNNTTWTTAEPYSTGKSWTLPSGYGIKTVYVKFKDSAGNWSNIYSDGIILDAAPELVSISFDDLDGSSSVTTGDTYLFKFSEPMEPVALSTNTQEANTNLSPDGKKYGTNNIIKWSTDFTEVTVEITPGFNIVGNELVNPSDLLTDRAGNPVSNSLNLSLTDVIKPVVTRIRSNYISPVSATNNYRLTIRFNSSMQTTTEPLVTINSTGSSSPVVPSGGTWMTTLYPNDTYSTPAIILSQGMDGRLKTDLSLARDFAGNIMLPETNIFEAELNATPPPNPTVLITDIKCNSATLSWSSYAPPSDLTGFQIYRNSTGSFSSVEGKTFTDLLAKEARSFVVTPLDLDTPYYVAVVAMDSLGNIVQLVDSQTILINQVVPPQVTAVVNGGIEPDSAIISWNGYDTSALCGLKEFRIYLENSDFTSVTALTPYATVNSSSKDFIINGLDRSKTYFIAVVGVNQANEFVTNVTTSGWSDPLAGEISSNITIGAGNQKAISMKQSMVVRNNAVITIVPGTTIYFAAGTGIAIEQGALIAEGTRLKPIILTSENDRQGYTPALGDWSGVTIAGTNTGSILRNVFIKYGGGLNLDGSTAIVEEFTALYNAQAGLKGINNAILNTSDALLSFNGAGVKIETGGQIVITNSVIKNNTVNATSDGTGALSAIGNWWGALNLSDINSKIVGAVNNANFLTYEPVLSPAVGVADERTVVSTRNISLILASRNAEEMRISEDSFFTNLFFKEFAVAEPFILSPDGGDKTIFAQFKSGTGKISDPVSVDVRYLTEGPVIGAFNLLDGQTIGRPKIVTAQASAILGLSTIEFYVDNILIHTDTLPSFSYKWDVRSSTNGIHRVKLVARDSAGNATTAERNVVIELLSPAAPQIITPVDGLTLTTGPVTIRGTAEPFIQITIRRNGFVVGSQVANENGLFEILNVVIQEGLSEFIATASDNIGNSPNSNMVNVTLDTGAPADPVMKSASPMDGRKISIVWDNPLTGEKPTKFNLYRHTSDFTDKNQATLVSAGITALSYINEQISDGTYYYGVIGFDGAGNSSSLSNIVVATYDGTKPSFEVSFGKVPPVGTGILNINLKVNELLADKPAMTIKPFGTAVPLAVGLTKIDDLNYGGIFEVKTDTPSGVAAINVSGRDQAGNLYAGVPSVGVLTIDTTGPTVSVTTTPHEPVQVLADTNVNINITFNESVKSEITPQLTFNPPVGTPMNIALSGSGANWTGILTLTSGMGSGLGQFVFSAVDALGNSGSTITSGNSLEIYNTATPSATAAPSNFKLTALAGGKVKVTWSGVEKAESYRLYRKDGACDTNPVNVVAQNLTFLEYLDTPVTDGTYCYALSALRLGAESELSLLASITSDSLAPNAPENILVSMGDAGVKISWNKPSTGETPAKYLVYRDGVNIKSIATNSANVEVRDYPGIGATYSYVISSSDEVGNETQSGPVLFILKLGAISNLQVLINNDDVPLLTWQKSDANTVGYNVYRNGTKINSALLTEPSFSDSFFSGNLDFIYEVRGVNGAGEESPGRKVEIFPVNLEVKANPDQDGNPQPLVINYLSKFEIKVNNNDSVDPFQLGALQLRMTVNGEEQYKSDKEVNSPIQSGTSYAESIVIPIDGSPDDHLLRITAIQPGEAGSQVIYQRHFLLTEVIQPSVMVEMTIDQLPLAGGYSTVHLCVNNSGYMDMDVIVNRVNGSKPGDIFVAIKNRDGMEISRTEYQGSPSGTKISSGIGYVTIAKGGSLCVDMNILVPESLAQGAELTFVVGVKGYAYQLTGINVVSVSNLIGTMQSGITFSDYYGTADADKTTYVNNELIVITGQSIDRASSTPKPNAKLKIGFYTRGFKWYQDVTTDENGNYRYEYRPGLGISGKFIIWAAHPDVYDRIDQDRFSLYRMYAIPEHGSIRTSKADTLKFKIDLLNPGEVPLSGFSSQFRAYTVDVDGNRVDVTSLQGMVNFPDGFQIGAGEKKNIELQLSADVDAPDAVNVEYIVNTSEGASVVFNCSVTLLQAVPIITLVSPASGYVYASLDTGAMFTVPVTIKNNGLENLLSAELKLPQNVLWISSNLQQVSAGKILLGDIKVGESKTFDLIFTPPADTSFGDYNDKITISGSNSPQQFDINVYALITSNLKGSVLFNVYNNLGQKVVGAIVGIHNNVIHQQISSLKTDASGDLTIADLNTGDWSYQVTAPGHNTVSGVVSVVAGQVVLVEPELVKNLVSVTFSVVPVPFTDRYEMKIEQKFDTHVPVPVLIIDPPYVQLPNVTPGFETTFIVKVSNFGLKGLDNVILETADTGSARLEPLITFFPRLGAMETVEVPYRVLYRGKGNTLPGSTAGDCASGLIPSIDFGGITDAVEGIGAIVRGSTNSYISQQEREAMGRLAVGILVAAHAANFAQGAAGVGKPVEFLASSAAQFAGCLIGSIISSAGTSTTPPPPYPSQPNYFTGNGGQGCFAEGTPVLMADGDIQKIEEIKVGDEVMAYDGKVTRVSKTYVRESDHILELRYSELTKDGVELIKRIETTDEHEFWVKNKDRWVPANRLEAGDILFILNGGEATVIEKQHLDIPVVVYNFDVEGYESYFVNGVLVHQKYGIGQENEADRNLRDFLKNIRESVQSLRE